MNATVTALHPARPTVPSLDRTAGARRTGLRLTRRGRLVVSVLTFAAVLLVGAAALLTVALPAASASASGVEQVTVEAGQTVWGLAVERGAEEPGEFVHEVRLLNNLTGTGITAGTTILVPVGDSA
jgi:hypothetical protein